MITPMQDSKAEESRLAQPKAARRANAMGRAGAIGKPQAQKKRAKLAF